MKTLSETKALAEQFRAVADDSAAVKKLAEDTSAAAANANDSDICDLCDDFVKCADGAAVRALADKVRARTV